MKILRFFLLFLLIPGCAGSRLPKEKFSQTSFGLVPHYDRDTAFFTIQNPLHTPLRISISSKEKMLQGLVKDFDTLIIDARTDTILKFAAPGLKKLDLKYHTGFGDPSAEVKYSRVAFPFPEDKTYKIIQGHNGSFSHNTDYSRYAIDFKMPVGDTVHSVADGYVIGVIKDYKDGGSTPDWRDYANFITIYHPTSGLYTQYVHLDYQGALVQVGEEVKKGQPIGISGLTGFTSGAHLHFNVLRPGKKGLISTPVEFEER